VDDALTEYSYDASMAGLHYSLREEDGTIILKQRGYTDKALILWQHLLEKMKSHIVQQDRFLVYKQEVQVTLNTACIADK
jgi:insulysin